MTMTTFIIIAVIVLSIPCVMFMISALPLDNTPKLSIKTKIQLAFTGILAFIADTIGIGSFAVLTAFEKTLKLCKDYEMPGLNNGAQIIPGALSSILFMQMVEVDFTTLITLVLGACVGGFLGGSIVTRLSNQKVRFAMMIAFITIAALLLLKEVGLFPKAGQILVLPPFKLFIGFIAMIFCGALTSFGIGAFAMIQAVLFLLQVSPVIAFPIMTTAGAMQQPITTAIFTKRNKVPIKKAFIIGLFGCIGVLIAFPIITHLNTDWLHRLLLLIMIYNIIGLALTYRREKKAINQVLQPRPTDC